MLRFLSISFVLFIFAACSPNSVPTKLKQLPTSFLVHSTKGIVFRATVDFKDYHFSGLVVVKPAKETIHIRFMSELGPTVMAFKLNKGNMEATKLLEQLRKDVFLTQLENDFRLLLMTNQYFGGEVTSRKAKDGFIRFKIKGKEKHSFWLNQRSYKIDKGKRKSTGIDSVIVNYSYEEGSKIPQTILLKHTIAGLALKLTKFN